MQYTAPKKIMDDVPVEGDAAEQVCAGCAAAGRWQACPLASACWQLRGPGEAAWPFGHLQACDPAPQHHCSSNSQLGIVIPPLQDAALNQGRRIADREDDYRKRRLARMISPARNDAFAMGDQTPDARVSTYADRMRESQLARERDNTLQVCCASHPAAACQPAHGRFFPLLFCHMVSATQWGATGMLLGL